ncbi:fimbria/pilus periplasmic chaperone [Simkania negevensis]|uniref:Fimbria/pilus periplasmic chaperone n=1 Tax=Simkania negevensis TaxID=83561 RepID=A0ABS3AWD5_9BACT|nr:fimbria/pilus periplasmic chaperone [Simkania negevensis]
MLKRIACHLLLCCAFLLFSSFSIYPIVQVFDPKGSGSTQYFQLNNESNDPIAIELVVYERKMDLDGNDELTRADDAFNVYPTQVVLMGQEQQKVQVSWLGDSNIKQEVAFRLIAEQLPISLQDPETEERESKGGFRVLLRYYTALYVLPKSAKPNVVIVSIEKINEKNGQPQLAVTLANNGTAHTVLKDFALQLSPREDREQKIMLVGKDIPEINRRTLLAKTQRRYILPWPQGIPYGHVQGTFSYAEQR